MSLYCIILLLLSLLGAVSAAAVLGFGKSSPAARSLAAYNAVFALWCFGQFMGEISPSPGSVLFWTRFNLTFAVLIPLTFLTFVYSFLGIRSERGPVLAGLALITAVFLSFIPTGYFIEQILPTEYFRFYPKGGPVYLIFLIAFAAVTAIGFAELIRAFRGSSGTKRNQTAYIMLASFIGFGGGALWFLPAFGFDIYPVGIFIVPFYLFIAAYAGLRHNLLDLNIVLKKGIAYSVMSLIRPASGKPDPSRFEDLAGIGVLAASIAHEIKNPLTAIKGMVQSLPQNADDRDFMESFNDIVPRQIEKINSSIERLLSSVRSRTVVEGPSKIEEFTLEEVLDDILFMIRMDCERAGIIIEKTAGPPSKLTGDKGLLSQAFFNIIINAMQAMPSGGRLGVNVSGAVVDVSDTGQGISKENVRKIFEPFFSGREGGTGMGLSIAAGIIEGAGGKIEVESREGKGTRFKIMF